LNAASANVDGNREAAEQHLQTALNVARQQGAKLYELRAATDLASLWRDQGKIAEASSLLQAVHDSIAEGDCPEDRAAAHDLLATLAV
jgi:predicted negative regulator of RcsB-dependent stress response